MISEAIKSAGLVSMDVLVIIGIFILFFAYAVYFGRNRIISLILAFYPAQFLYSIFPFLDKLLILKGDVLVALNELLVFLVFLVPLDIIITRFIFADSEYGSRKMFKTAGLALCGTSLTLVLFYSVVNLEVFFNFSDSIDLLFSGADKIFYWNLGPLVLLFFL